MQLIKGIWFSQLSEVPSYYIDTEKEISPGLTRVLKRSVFIFYGVAEKRLCFVVFCLDCYHLIMGILLQEKSEKDFKEGLFGDSMN